MKVKFCGIRRAEEIFWLNKFRPDYAGFVFAGTKRRVTPEQAAKLAEYLDPAIGRVGVFVNETPENVNRAARVAALNVVQLHGEEAAETIAAMRALLPHGVQIWKAVRVRSAASIWEAQKTGADCLLLDSFSPSVYGGTGQTADWGVIRAASPARPFFLAGGLNAGNIRAAIQAVSPDGVDLSSGIETSGVKDRRKMQQIMRILREKIDPAELERRKN